LGGNLIVVGSDGEKYWLLEIDRHNTAGHYTDDGFHTIGSAAVATHVGRRLLSHYRLPGYEPRHLCLLAVRTVQASIEVLGSAYGIGGPVQLWQSTADGYEAVEGGALERVMEGLDVWMGIEQESLVTVFSSAGEETPSDLPDVLTEDSSTEAI
jgi:hypothetical protein